MATIALAAAATAPEDDKSPMPPKAMKTQLMDLKRAAGILAAREAGGGDRGGSGDAPPPPGDHDDGDDEPQPLAPLLLLSPEHASPFADEGRCVAERSGPAPLAAYACPSFLADAAARLAMARALAAAAVAATGVTTTTATTITVPLLLQQCMGNKSDEEEDDGKPLREGDLVEVRRACRGTGEGGAAAAAGNQQPNDSTQHQVLLRGTLRLGGIACECPLCAQVPGLAIPPSAFVAHAYGWARRRCVVVGGGSGDDKSRKRRRRTVLAFCPPSLPAAAQIFLPRVGPSGASLEDVVALANEQQQQERGTAAAATARCVFCGRGNSNFSLLRSCGGCGAFMHPRCCGWVMMHGGQGHGNEAAERGAPCPLCLVAGGSGGGGSRRRSCS